MAPGIAADVVVDMTVHCLVILPRHAFAALATAFAMLEELVGGILNREFRRIAAEGAGAHLTFGRELERVGFLAAVELPALAMAVRVHEVHGPAHAFGAIGIPPSALADRHKLTSLGRLAPTESYLVKKRQVPPPSPNIPIISQGFHFFHPDPIGFYPKGWHCSIVFFPNRTGRPQWRAPPS
jgi:hypothetical protein